FQDSDDEWLIDKLQQQWDRLSTLPSNVALTQGAILRDEGDRARYLFTGLPSEHQDSAILPCNNTTFIQAWLARTSVLREMGGFDERLQLWEDWELLIRICQRYAVDMDSRIMSLVHDTPDSLIKQAH